MHNVYTRCLVAAVALLAASAGTAGAQVDSRVQPGVRVRAWLPESQLQEHGPWRRQLLRATVTDVDADTLRLIVPGTSGSIALARAEIRRLDVSRGTSRAASAFERAVTFGITAALSAAITNDPGSTEWPNADNRWRAAGEGAKWGAAFGAVVGLTLPTERWRRVRVR